MMINEQVQNINQSVNTCNENKREKKDILIHKNVNCTSCNIVAIVSNIFR
jgi:hypothetical protein